MKLPECAEHPGAEVRQRFELGIRVQYECDLVERCAICGRRLAVYGVLWKGGASVQLEDDGA